MIRLSASLTKKLPLPDVQYSSRSYSASIEVEVASGAKAEELKGKFKALYALLEEAVDEQLKESLDSPADAKTQPRRKALKERNNGNSKMATQAQIKAIQAIAHDRGVTEQELEDLTRELGVTSLSALSIRQASSLIDRLKNGKDSP